MLQQMSSPASSSCTNVGKVAAYVRSPDGRVFGDVFYESSENSSDAAEDSELPQCRIKRNYNCAKCTFYTQNPRAYLVHMRDIHFERIKIYDCQYCVYASKTSQKLARHIKMVHSDQDLMSKADVENKLRAETDDPIERIEDLLEEIEECDDSMDVDDCIEESFEQSTDIGDGSSAPADLTKDGNQAYFSCSKCNYATHIRSRYTKHVKYHSMPMIKCTVCDFRTPYKWNLDRHMKNHGGSGSFHCSMCNFTADIKQSLTVHEMNHHTPPVGQSGSNRRRNRVGASDIFFEEPLQSRLVISKEEGSGDSRSSHSASDMGMQYVEKEVVSCNSDSNDGGASSTGAKNEQLAHVSSISPNSTNDDTNKQNKKTPKPLPKLIPIVSSTPNQSKTSGEPPAKKFKEDSKKNGSKFENLPIDITLIPVNNTSKETTNRKKNISFFDKLKQRLLTETGEEGSLVCKNCGFQSKCLSEHSVHEKTCTPQTNKVVTSTSAPSLGSTRCQNCRHRCKSSADLLVHLKTCRDPTISDIDNLIKNQDSNEATTSNQEKDTEPHPMENVVFVWNNINQIPNKFDMPLDIRINDDSTLPEAMRSFELENVDDNESMNLSPSQALGKKVFKCPHCPFWASTASRFHVHIVGHLNKKPFECSLCKYKSNWRWDITKHIKLKSVRDPEHNEANVLMTDETGRRNYTKYNKFLAIPIVNEYGEREFDYLESNPTLDSGMDDMNDTVNQTYDTQPLNLQTQHSEFRFGPGVMDGSKKVKKTLWKCKKCNYKDPSKEALLEHVRQHTRSEDQESTKKEPAPDPADLAYRCGHCNQLSNWKHVIQRHCRLKHDGIIKVITTVKPKPEDALHEMGDACTKCPYRSNDKRAMLNHVLQHQPSPQSIFKCYFCPFFVKNEQELVQHLTVHGITDPEEYVAKAMGCKSPIPEPGSLSNTPGSSSSKRHKCTECPYETNSKSQYMYHEQFHRLPADTPYKCQECNYSVSKRHLLHQHMRVHGIFPKKDESEAEMEAAASNPDYKNEAELDESPFVWVSAKNEFHKMYKCRYCCYVNSQKSKIPNHEKLHYMTFENSEVMIYKCLECRFTCDNAVRIASHSKSHGEIYGRIYCLVDEDIPDDDQIAKLRKVLEAEKSSTDDAQKDEETLPDSKDLKTVYFCHKCPARFFTDIELKEHDKFHDSSPPLPSKCKHCDFSTNTENELNYHLEIHSDEYNTKTKMLKFMHCSHPSHKGPRLEVSNHSDTSETSWVVTSPSKNYLPLESNAKKSKQYSCKECPAKFFKSSALTYHLGLHGGEGEHKCKKCSYSVKNVGNLARHELLHENQTSKDRGDFDESGDDIDYKIPLSGTDLFQRKTEAQKRVLTDKDKLVKPNDHFPPVLQADPQFGYLMHGNPEFIYPTYLKNGRQKEKRYKCHKCPSAFEKREQYKIHLSLHGSKQRYKCELCDYSVKYYANYVQHMRKHQMNDEAQAERKKGSDGFIKPETNEGIKDVISDNISLAIKTMPKGTAKSDFQQFSISDQQTLRILQRRRSMNNSGIDVNASETSPVKSRTMHNCLLCPYTNQRLDALTNHYRRHDETAAQSAGSKCSHCDFVVQQSHFLREHLKSHFNYQKTFSAECYVANQDVCFTVTKIDDEENSSTDLKIETHGNNLCNDDKMFVNMKTGELLVE